MWKILTEEEERQQEIELNQKLEQFKPIIESVTFDEMLLVDNELDFWEEKLKNIMGISTNEETEDEIFSMITYVSLAFFNSLDKNNQERYINRKVNL